MYTMQEKDLTISARAVDLNLVKKAATHAAGEFEKTAGYAVKVEVNGELPKGR